MNLATGIYTISAGLISESNRIQENEASRSWGEMLFIDKNYQTRDRIFL